MLTSLISLIDSLKNLARRKAELDKDFFEQFIEPVWNTFGRVHEMYVEAFDKYVHKEIILIDDLIKDIMQDSDTRAELKIQLTYMIEHMPTPLFRTKKKYLTNFVIALMAYFDTHDSLIAISDTRERERKFHSLLRIRSEDHLGSPISTPLIVGLSRKGSEEAHQVLFSTIDRLRQKYAAVTDSYYQLRKALLT